MSYPYKFALDAELNRRRVHDIVIAAIEKAAREKGVTQSQIAKTIGRKPSQVSAWLSGPSNWTLDTINDLLRAIDASMDYKVVFDAERIVSNVVHPASLDPDPSLKPPPSTASAPLQDSSLASGAGVQGETTWPTNPQQGTTPIQAFRASGTNNIVKYMRTLI
jgi:transcriptional regulator with XRE-family HTH domain